MSRIDGHLIISGGGSHGGIMRKIQFMTKSFGAAREIFNGLTNEWRL